MKNITLDEFVKIWTDGLKEEVRINAEVRLEIRTNNNYAITEYTGATSIIPLGFTGASKNPQCYRIQPSNQIPSIEFTCSNPIKYYDGIDNHDRRDDYEPYLILPLSSDDSAKIKISRIKNITY